MMWADHNSLKLNPRQARKFALFAAAKVNDDGFVHHEANAAPVGLAIMQFVTPTTPRSL
jgi:hypothetical protein